MALTFTTLAAAKAAAATYFTTAPAYVVAIHTTVGSLAVKIDRTGLATEA